MSKFDIGDKVSFETGTIAIYDGKDLTGKVGTVKKVFDRCPIVLVDFDGETCKLSEFSLVKTKAPTTVDSKEIVELTREDFHDLTVRFTSLKYFKDLVSKDPGLFGGEIDDVMIHEFADVSGIILDLLERDLFGENL